MPIRFQKFISGAVALTALVFITASGSHAATFSLDVANSCTPATPAQTSTTGFNSAGSGQCNNLTNGTTGQLLGSRLVTYQHIAGFGFIDSGVAAFTETTDIDDSRNTGASSSITTVHAADELSFTGGPSEFDVLFELVWNTNVQSTVTSATFASFNLSAQRVGGFGPNATDGFKVVDYANSTSSEIFDTDPFSIRVNSGATIKLSSAFRAQATSSSIAGTNDSDQAIAEGQFQWFVTVPETVTLSSTSGAAYEVPPIAPVPVPASLPLMLLGFGAIFGLRARKS